MTSTRRIAVLLSQDISYFRQVMLGIRDYALRKKNWVFHYASPEQAVLSALRKWEPHGIIVNLIDAKFCREILKLDLPVVDIGCSVARPGTIPLVDTDHEAVGRMAAEHFLTRGYLNYGFFGSGTTSYSQFREASFCRTIAEAGYSVSACHVKYNPRMPSKTDWKTVDGKIRRWLEQLPKPVAIFTPNDVPAHDLANICQQLGLRIPEEIALLGVDNDEVECYLASPPLSSVEVPSRRIGYETAQLLDRMLADGGKRPESLFLPPIRVVTRQSTSIMAVEDPVVARTLSYIHEHFAEKLSVKTLAQDLGVRRRNLETKFRALLNSSVLQQIHRQRIEYAKELLSGTDLKIATIARRSGFSTSQSLALVFKQFTGMLPNAYRRQSKLVDRD